MTPSQDGIDIIESAHEPHILTILSIIMQINCVVHSGSISWTWVYVVLCCAKDLFCNANEKNNPVFTWQRCWKSVLGNVCWPQSRAVSRGWGNCDTHTVTVRVLLYFCKGSCKGCLAPPWHRTQDLASSLGRPIWSSALSVVECLFNLVQLRTSKVSMSEDDKKGHAGFSRELWTLKQRIKGVEGWLNS